VVKWLPLSDQFLSAYLSPSQPHSGNSFALFLPLGYPALDLRLKLGSVLHFLR